MLCSLPNFIIDDSYHIYLVLSNFYPNGYKEISGLSNSIALSRIDNMQVTGFHDTGHNGIQPYSIQHDTQHYIAHLSVMLECRDAMTVPIFKRKLFN